jgi:hypothetical protein
MIVPNSLPWKQANDSTLQDCIEGSDDYIIAERFGSDDDQEYCINACNNFPKSIELLKEAVRFINTVPNTRYGDTLSYATASRIDKFLKEVDNE